MAKEKKSPAPKSDNTMYKAMVDLGILVVGFFLLQAIGKNYVNNVEHFETWRTAFSCAAIVFAVIFLAGVVLAIIKKNVLRKVGITAAVAGGILAIASWAFYRYWSLPLAPAYFFLVAGCVLYLIFLLYPTDFFLIATLTTAVGGIFYTHGQQGAASLRTIVLYVIVAAALVCALLLAKKGASNGGKVAFCKKTFRLFNTKSAGPIPMYLCSAIWLTCIVASLVLGGNFAYYCTYAAAGGLFIAACYYTIRLD